MKTNRLFILIIFSFLTLSCSENQEYTEPSYADLVTFNNVEEYREALNNIISMDSNERKKYEETNGYLSFGRECEEFYNSIDFDKFKTFEELESFVEKNSDYLVLNKDYDGELYLETVLCNNINRFFIDKDHIFRVGNDIYKVFDDGIVISDMCNMDELKKMNFSSINMVIENNDYHIVKHNTEIIENDSKDLAYNCGAQAIVEEVNNRDKTTVMITSIVDHYEDCSYVGCYVVVRPYKKTLGVWFFCSRTISADITVANDWYVSGVWQRTIFSGSTPGTGDSVWSFSSGFYTGDLNAVSHIGGYNGWADTPSTPTVVLECNSEIL